MVITSTGYIRDHSFSTVRKIFRKTNITPWYAQYVCVLGGKNCKFFGKFCVRRRCLHWLCFFLCTIIMVLLCHCWLWCCFFANDDDNCLLWWIVFHCWPTQRLIETKWVWFLSEIELSERKVNGSKP